MATYRTKAAVLTVAAVLAALGVGWIYEREVQAEVQVVSPAPNRTRVAREAPPVVLLDVPEEAIVEPEPEALPAEERHTAAAPTPPPILVPVIQTAGPEPGFVDESERARKVTGLVVDLDGAPTKAHVALVNDGGSVSMSTGDDGRFEIDPSTGEVALIAHTKDGQVGVLSGLQLEEGFGRSDLSITVQPGAEVLLTLEGGKESLRCALLQGHVLFNDFTLRNGQTAKKIVPPGPILVRLYEGRGVDRVVFAERALHVPAGGSESAKFLVP